MPKYEIKKKYDSRYHSQTVDADEYRHEGEFFVFYDAHSAKVLTIASGLVKSIDVITE